MEIKQKQSALFPASKGSLEEPYISTASPVLASGRPDRLPCLNA